MKKYVHEIVAKHICFKLLTVEEVIDTMSKYPKEAVLVSQEDNSDWYSVVITRLETDDEYEERMKFAEKLKLENEAKEFEEYLRLKSKFEKEK